MAATTHYLDTALNARSDYDMPTSAPGSTTLTSSNVNNTSFETCLQGSFLIGAATIDSTTVPCTIDVNSHSGSLELRWQLFQPDPVFGDKATSGWSSTYSFIGVLSESLTFNPSLVAGDYYGLRVQIRRTAGHGNVAVTLNIPGTLITPDYTPPAGPSEEWWIIS